jgi:hypothetical protein
MAQQVCPLLCTLDASNRRGPHIEFPSFENQCLATGIPELILLGDQATSCLSPAHTVCPRFRASHHVQEGDAAFVPFFATAEDAWQQGTPAAAGIAGLSSLGDAAADGSNSRTRWGRLGAALIFLSVLLCGSFTAAYTGWDWITRDLRTPATAGRVDMTAAENAVQAAPTPAVYVVMTATPIQVVVAAPYTDAAAGSTNTGIIPVLPAAVTPTPIRVEMGAPSATAPEPVAPGAGDPAIDVDLLVPTRRPTPEFDVPTSTPFVEEAPTAAPTDTPSVTPTPLGTPIIIFAPAEKELEKGECTMVRWNVQNVREVYYENLPMNGQGEREECINDEDEVYTLLVVLPNGSPQIYTTTVSYLPPTPTPTMTPVFTAEPVHTATWTPEPPTPTAPPNLFYAVNLAVNGPSEINCAAGQTCEVGLLVTNGGSGTDNVSVLLLANDIFPVQLCRPDGVCGNSVPINNMGASNTAFVTARFSVPADAAPQSRGTGTFQARSDGSGGGVTSEQIGVTVVVP